MYAVTAQPLFGDSKGKEWGGREGEGGVCSFISDVHAACLGGGGGGGDPLALSPPHPCAWIMELVRTLCVFNSDALL